VCLFHFFESPLTSIEIINHPALWYPNIINYNLQ